MKWVKANDRMPEENKNLVWRFIDKTGVYRGFTNGEFNFGSSVKLNTILQKQFKTEIEWLDELEEFMHDAGFKFSVCFSSENQHTKDEIILEVMKALRGFDEDCFIGISTDAEPA